MNAVVWILLVLAAVVALVSAIGAAVMRDPLQRLHYIAPPATLSAALVTVAVFIDDPNKDVGAKALFVTVVLSLMNGVGSHATARGARVRERGTWLPTRGEHVPVRGRNEEVTS